MLQGGVCPGSDTPSLNTAARHVCAVFCCGAPLQSTAQAVHRLCTWLAPRMQGAPPLIVLTPILPRSAGGHPPSRPGAPGPAASRAPGFKATAHQRSQWAGSPASRCAPSGHAPQSNPTGCGGCSQGQTRVAWWVEGTGRTVADGGSPGWESVGAWLDNFKQQDSVSTRGQGRVLQGCQFQCIFFFRVEFH